MKTTQILVSGDRPDPGAVARAAAILKGGGIVAFPTETVYGLGADAFNSSAIQRIFEAKGRPSDNPLIVHIAELSFLDSLAGSFPDVGHVLAKTFWPGPLTLVVQKTSQVPGIVTAGLDTVAVRMPNHQVALSLLRQFGRGIVAPSANVSGRPSPTTAQHVIDDLGGRIDIVLDSGPTLIGVESTVLDITVAPPIILRKGGLSKEAIENVIGTVLTEPDEHLSARSPGNRYKHYAPRARVVLVAEGDAVGLEGILRRADLAGKRVVCILHSIPDPSAGVRVFVQRASPEIDLFSHFLFDYLRQGDKSGADVIVVEAVSEAGLGAAVMDRLRRASSAGAKWE
jgi:L-threonylcarbamoyladenylate synthase